MHSQSSVFSVIVSASEFELLDATGATVLELASSTRIVRTLPGSATYAMTGLVFEPRGNEVAPSTAALLHGPHPTLPTTRGSATVVAGGSPTGDPLDAPQLVLVGGSTGDDGYVKLQQADAVSATSPDSGAHVTLSSTTTNRQAIIAAPGRSTVPIQHASLTLNGSTSLPGGGGSSALLDGGNGALQIQDTETDLFSFGSAPIVIETAGGSISGNIAGSRRLTLDSSQALMRVGAAGGYVQAAPDHVGIGPTSVGRVYLNARPVWLPVAAASYALPGTISVPMTSFLLNGIGLSLNDGDRFEVTAQLRVGPSAVGGGAFVGALQVFGPGANLVYTERLIAEGNPFGQDFTISGRWLGSASAFFGGSGSYAFAIIGGYTANAWNLIAPDSWYSVTVDGIR